MKNLRMVISSLILSACCLNAGISVYAEDVNDVNINEEIQIEEAIDEFSELAENPVSVYSIGGEDYESSLNLDGYDLEKAYKSYSLDGLIIDDYKAGTEFSSLISDEYRVYVPSDLNLITLYPNKETGILEVIGTAELTENDFEMVAEAEKIKSQITEEIIDLKFTQAFIYNLELIYITTAENEYAVPYFSGMINESIAGRIENGKLYTVDEFVQAMDNTFDLEKHDPMSLGGVPFKPLSNEATANAAAMNNTVNNTVTEKSNNYFVIYASAAAVVIVGAGIGIFVFEKKRKNKNK